MKVQPPSSCGMPLVTAAWCGFLRDGIEGRWESEAGVGRLLAWKDVFGETQETGAAGCSIPLPGEPPPPRGRFPIDTVPCRRQALIGLTESSIKSRFLPVHGIRTIAMHCPPPRKGAGGGRASGREVGVVYEYRSTIDTGDRGGGKPYPPPPSPASPSPRGRFPIDALPRKQTASLP